MLINLSKYCIFKQLHVTFDSEDSYGILRDRITGGLSNVQHRLNLNGITKINKLKYNPTTNTVSNYDIGNVMTHFVGVDFNSLYPSVFSSKPHVFIKYTDSKMCMPGRLTGVIKVIRDDQTVDDEVRKKALSIIHAKKSLFVAEIKGHIPKEYINGCINFLPILRNINIRTDQQTIGSFMYNYMKTNHIPVDRETRKLTQLASTHGEWMSFSYY